jgi:hypothetical protein
MWFKAEMQRTAPHSAGARAILPFSDWTDIHLRRMRPVATIEKNNQYSTICSAGVRKSAMTKSNFTSPAPKPNLQYPKMANADTAMPYVSSTEIFPLIDIERTRSMRNRFGIR